MFTFLFSLGISHKCIHDEKYGSFLQQHLSRRTLAVKNRDLKDEDWKPIRIKFITDWLDGTKDDQYMCKEVGQNVTLGRYTYTCTSADLLTPAKIEVIKGTLVNLQSFLSRLIKVVPRTEPVKMQYNRENDFNSGGEVTTENVDMAVFVTGRTFGTQLTLASAVGWIPDDYNRPTAGYIDINVRKLPKQPASENDWNNEFFYTLVHEMFHAFGISRNHFNNFHPYNTNAPHSQIFCELTKYGKNFKFMVTPYAHIFAKKRFGDDKFVGDDGRECPSGIEIEDGGSAAGSHIEFRSYLSELMVGTTISQNSGPLSRLTDASLALLMDSGNYKVDWLLGQPLVWGNQESVDGKPIPNFAIGPPQLTYPKGYVYISYNYPSFDYKFWGGTARTFKDSEITPADCAPNYIFSTYCGEARYKFYNPKKWSVYESEVFDFMAFVLPMYTCPKNKALFPGESDYGNTGCRNYTCDWYDKYDVPFSNTTVTCTKETIGQKFTYWESNVKKTITCLDPERFCRTMALYDMHFTKDPFDPNTKQLPQKEDPIQNPDGTSPDGNSTNSSTPAETDENPDDQKDKDAKKKKMIIIGAAAAGAVVLIIIIVVAVVVSKKGCNKGEEHSPDIDEMIV
ncbi:GP63-like [Trichomonas vaginalis G3]|uniref:GP63-like n=1 Tax=Trichomonas vaginalis (strain ATCC PRA-98 / G3) TaxID=412133 RepID=A2E1K6_TRIV3|nr:regulation of choline O-acetyltransferase protein [Trichomonas vaginalis G3]EAY13453.1 GP63-like [Trichomonas vaginalis G3]KAI5518352.1 regulation of choline O-acetyltransferase protein [Trichomonas vaginalis G3]|eukprot:XP_001325676.1 GP63-like [Trichomonas vaginalis G3]